MEASKLSTGETAAPVLDESRIWRARDGNIPLLDHPALIYSAHKWERPPMINIDMTMRRLQNGEIGPPDLTLTRILLSWRCLTERQLRYLARHYFAKGHEIASRLRLLQKVGWFDGFYIETPEGKREYIWMLGLAAFQYYDLIEGIEGLQDPISLMRYKDNPIAMSAVNEFRLQLEERGRLPAASYAPVWRKGDEPRPYMVMKVQSEQGPLTLYVERLSQKGKPLSFMRKKIEMYEAMLAQNDGKLPSEDGGAAMVVWSVGSLQAIEEIVGSMDYIPESFFQAFLVDECLENFPHAFFLAQKGRRVGEVNLQPLQMDLL